MKAEMKVVNVKRDNLWIEVGEYDENLRRNVVEVRAGSLVILVENEFVGPSNFRNRCGERNYSFVDYASNPEGIGGNMDPTCKRLEGWRGTTDDWSVRALGVWRVQEVGESRFWDERPDPKYGFPGTRLCRVALEKVEV